MRAIIAVLTLAPLVPAAAPALDCNPLRDRQLLQQQLLRRAGRPSRRGPLRRRLHGLDPRRRRSGRLNRPGIAADLIDHYLAHRADLIEAQRGYPHLHAGELRSYHGDDRRALDHLAQAVVTPDSMPDHFPRSFNAGDMDGVRTSIEAIRTMPGLAKRDSMFLRALEYLATKEGKTYREAMLEMPE
jgi:hypothetical protein